MASRYKITVSEGFPGWSEDTYGYHIEDLARKAALAFVRAITKETHNG